MENRRNTDEKKIKAGHEGDVKKYVYKTMREETEEENKTREQDLK